MSKVFVRDREFYKLLLALGLPIVLKNLIVNSVGMADNLMVAALGEAATNGAQMANQLTNFLFTITMNVSAAVTVLATQYWGKRETRSIKTLAGIGLKFSMALGVAAFILGFFFPDFTLGLFTNDAQAIEAGRGYLRIVAWTYLIYSVTDVLVAVMTSVENVRLGLVASMSASLTNIVLNYLLIFGLNVGGAQIIPRCGIEGAAVATLISRIVEIGIVVVYVFFMDQKLRPGLGELLRGNKLLLMDYLKYGLPVIGGGVVWAVNVSVQGAIIGKLGVSTAITAYSVANTFFSVITVAMFGLSAASSIVIGKAVGAGDVEKVKQYAKTLQLIFLGLGVITGGILFACRWLLPVVYPKYSPEALDMSRQFLIVLAVTTIGTSYQACSLTGIVRAGGDTAFVFMNDSIWVPVVLFTAYLAGYVFGAPPWLVFALLKGDQIYKCFVAIFKVNRFKWIRNITRTEAPQQA